MLYLVESNLYPMKSTYGTRLAEALQSANMDRQTLADALSISVQAIGQVIAGKTKALTAENTARAARVLKVDWYWLATGEGSSTLAHADSQPWPFRKFTFEQWRALLDESKIKLEGYAEALFIEDAPKIEPSTKKLA